MAVLMVGSTSVQHLPRLAGMAVGFAVVLGGVLVVTFHARLTRAFNAFYAEMPGRFRYPPWFVRLLGYVFTAFGLGVVIVSAAVGH